MSDNVFAYLDPEPSPGSLAHPDAVWAQAREDYLGGESAGVVCQRYSLSRSRFFERAKAEGWRRRDRERDDGAHERAAYDAEADAAFVCSALEAPATPAYALARRAWAMAERAILLRRRIEAAGWVRVARDLRRLAMEEVGALDWERTVKRSEPPQPQPQPPPEPEAAPEAPTEAVEPPGGPPPVHAPQAGRIPDGALTSQGKLALWLEQEFGPAVRGIGLPGFGHAAPDSPDQSRRTADCGPAEDSPAPVAGGTSPAPFLRPLTGSSGVVARRTCSKGSLRAAPPLRDEGSRPQGSGVRGEVRQG